MKVLKLLLICFITPIFLSAQPLLGIGEIKLGRSFTEIQQALGLNIYIVNADKKKNKELRKSKQVLEDIPYDFQLDKYQNAVFKIDRVDSWAMSMNDFIKTFDTIPSQAIYYIPEYKIATLEISKIFLLFRNNKLAFIDVAISQELMNALKQKYPPSDNIDITDTVKCTYTFTGAVTDNISFKQEVTWKNDKSYCQYLFEKNYTSDCKPTFNNYFRFYDLEFYNDQQKKKLKEVDRLVEKYKENNKKLIDSL